MMVIRSVEELELSYDSAYELQLHMDKIVSHVSLPQKQEFLSGVRWQKLVLFVSHYLSTWRSC